MGWWRESAADANFYAPLIGGAMLLGCLVVFYVSVDTVQPVRRAVATSRSPSTDAATVGDDTVDGSIAAAAAAGGTPPAPIRPP